MLYRPAYRRGKITRREFLKTAGITLGAAAVACSGAGCDTQPGVPAENGEEPAQVETPSFQYGDQQAVKNRILVVYATRTGSTVGVASAIGETLAARGFAVDVKPVSENPSPEGCQAVVIGSAVNGAQWLPEAVAYVTEHQAELQQVPVALFCVHIMNLGSDEGSKKKRLAYLNAVRAVVPPVDEAFFAGMGMKPEETPAFTRWFYRTFKIGPEGDCRDWEKIRAWAQAVSL